MTRGRLRTVCLLFALGILPACTSGSVLEPSALTTDSGTTSATATGPAAVPGAADRNTAAIPPATGNRLQFAPIIGTPVEAATPLTNRLAQRARERGIAITSGEQAYTLKGYFSALPEGRETTVIYVWDVLDAAGNRLHRIQGQEVAPGGKGWPSVPPATMEAIADQTVDQLANWFERKTG